MSDDLQPGDSCPPGDGDIALMERAQEGDASAFGQLVRRHQSAVRAYLASRLLQRSDADDLTQEVFLRCYQSRARFDTHLQVRPFLMGIARNVLREHSRSAKRRRETLWTEICQEVEAHEAEDEPLYDDLLGHLPECLQQLSTNARQALELHYRQKQRHATIGSKLDRSAGAVKLLLFRARKTLKRCLDRKLHSHADD